MSDYTPSGKPEDNTRGISKQVRDEFVLVQAAVSSKTNGYAGTEAQGATVNDYVVTLTPAIAAYVSNSLIAFMATHTNTGAATLKIDSLAAKTIKDSNGNPMLAGDIVSGALVMAFYNGTDFYLVSGNNKANINSPALTGIPTAPTASTGTSNAQVATTQFVANTSFTTNLPAQSGNNGKLLKTNGTDASWSSTIDTSIVTPIVGGTFATRIGVQTLTNKTVADLILADGTDNTKKANFILSGVTAGQNRNITVEDKNILLKTPGWVYLSTVTASASATVDLETTIDSTYDAYVITFDNLRILTAGTSLYLRLKIGGSYHSGSTDYIWYYITAESGSPGGNSELTGNAQILLADDINVDSDKLMSGALCLYNPSNSANKKRVSWELFGYRNSIVRPRAIYGHGTDISSNNPVTGVRFLPSSGTITSGNFNLFGIRKA